MAGVIASHALASTLTLEPLTVQSFSACKLPWHKAQNSKMQKCFEEQKFCLTIIVSIFHRNFKAYFLHAGFGCCSSV